MARVLGLRLLRVDGVVLLSPGRLVEPRTERAVTSRPTPPPVGASPRELGSGLAQAADLLRQCEESAKRRAG